MSVDVIRCRELGRQAAIEALVIWREAAQWLCDRGVPQWDPAMFDERFVDDALADGLIIGATLADNLAGVLLLQWRDELWWPDRAPDTAAYIHKLVVTRAAAGRGIADALVHECERRTRDLGLPFVRLDTGKDRPPLLALYTRLGYLALDTRSVGAQICVRFEKRL